MTLKKRQRKILETLIALGGRATTREIAAKAGLDVNGVSQSLGAMKEHVHSRGGKAGDRLWEMSVPVSDPATRAGQLRLVE